MVHLNFAHRASLEPSGSTCEGKPSSGVDQPVANSPGIYQNRSTNLAKARVRGFKSFEREEHTVQRRVSYRIPRRHNVLDQTAQFARISFLMRVILLSAAFFLWPRTCFPDPRIARHLNETVGDDRSVDHAALLHRSRSGDRTLADDTTRRDHSGDAK